MTLFDFLTDILHEKSRRDLNSADFADLMTYSPYIINRFLSQYSDEVCYIVNHTVNEYNENNWDKEHHYKLMLNILPRLKKKFIRYIKKNNEKKVDCVRCAELHEISRREVQEYVKEFGIDIKKYNSK